MQIRLLHVSAPLALAPMVGLSHSATRRLLLELGGVGMLFTEMLAARRLPHENEYTSPLLVRSEVESPLVYQIFLADEQPVSAAVKKLELLGADGIDVNLGCPAPQLRRRGAGGFLAENINLVKKILSELRCMTELPVSVKIRLGRGLDKHRLINFSKMLEGEGVDFITVHGRLHGEKFCRTPRWDWISFVKNSVSVPVFANGGVFSVTDAARCLEMSGADGLMLGRGAMEKPWLFADIARELFNKPIPHSFTCKMRVYFRFIDLLKMQFPAERRLGRLKQFTHYYAQPFSFGHHLASRVQRCNTIEEVEQTATRFFAGVDNQELSL